MHFENKTLSFYFTHKKLKILAIIYTENYTVAKYFIISSCVKKNIYIGFFDIYTCCSTQKALEMQLFILISQAFIQIYHYFIL